VDLYEAGSSRVTQRAEVADPRFHDAVAVRAGAEWTVRPAWKLRAGFGFQQSPVPAQTGETNLLDGHRFTGALGAGFDAEGVGGPAIALDAHLAWAFLVSNRDKKQGFEPGNPGWPNIAYGGSVLNAGATVKVGF
jgi:long-subunit fatty acid transport protein